MMWKLVYIVWYNDVESCVGTVDLTDLKDLHVIAKHLRGHLEWSNIYHFNLWVLQAEYSTELCILPL
jgi:hypothetical protein